MKITVWIMLLSFNLAAHFLSAQNEDEIVSIQYAHWGKSQIESDDYPALNRVSTRLRMFGLSLNYGHSLGHSPRTDMTYSMSYRQVHKKLNLTMADEDTLSKVVPKNYYDLPPFFQASFSGGLKHSFSDNWYVYGLFSLNMAGALSKNRLKPNTSWSNLSYIEHHPDNRLSYGAGMYLNQMDSKLLVAPVIRFQLQGPKCGIDFLFPEKIRVWQRISDPLYLEAYANSNSYSLKYRPSSKIRSTDLYTVVAGLAVNFILEDYLRLSAGVDFPFLYHIINTEDKKSEYLQRNSLSINIGLRLILPYE